ncbi:MAG: hypothetical protein E6L04_08960 [Thaumarchaeota archaeon]|nr:MAG: hypothetical protein E6L04_08960 [Nitrososphaerota archaeon]TLX87274.1 MAG: hypothetical protein E6K97_08960 [Nitrososphaerota archaeon]
MIQQSIPFHSKHCASNQHQVCYGAWTGFGFEVYCDCYCHKRKNNAADGFGSLDSAAPYQVSLEVTKEIDK